MSVYFLLYFATFGTLFPYLNLHYHRLGVTATELGLMAGTATVIGLFLQPMWGFVADRSARRTRFLSALLLAVAGAAVVLSTVRAVGTVIAVGICFSLLAAPLTPISDSVALAEASARGTHYARLRLWGAVGWILTTAASGWLYDQTGLWPMFYLTAGGLGLCALWTWRLPDWGAASGPRLTVRAALQTLAANRQLAAVLLIAFLVQAAWSVHLLFLPIYMSNQGAPEGLVGTAFSIGALAEVPIFFLIGRIAKRTGPLPPLVGAVLIQVTLYVLMSLSPSPYQMVAINTLSGVYFATYYPTIVTLVGALTPESLKATGQGLLAAFTWGLGNMAGTVIGGRVADLFGIPALYGYLVYVAVVGAAGYSLLWLILRRKVTQERRAS